MSQADIVIASSQRLADTLGQTRPAVLIRNGSETEFFRASNGDAVPEDEALIGYFGAIEDWFEIGLDRLCSAKRPTGISY